MKYERVTKKIGYLYWSNRTLFTKLFPHPLGPGQAAFLIYLTEDTEVRQETLASMIGVDKAIGTRVIRKLNEAGYIRRRRDPENYRAYLISLTEEGNEMKDAILEVSNFIDESLLNGFTDEERDMMHNLLDRMIVNIGQIFSLDPEEAA
ncbi:MAG: Transcriptional regulator, MarR family [Methanomicrobiales archaeon 53_19]|uniref:MarR family winged helix-turn-helix transcriptional regulator n=1 Tax=Methanocalculus sp. TaxID=2004547 RepID=UPI000746D408|nr:MarR family transcriptional regulator [Methanocalculus sp.]KUK69876.1 MAG: Transcriptional regulator, MarR family [Methanocalculus sp. 52_23]KUL04469.1 MAG: Transcriptional regulator, MarR family [Methanomicrobiales archaeon 53_19]HIJ07681.1 MarR family transcriptional regulator [Methanocalculus sp.]